MIVLYFELSFLVSTNHCAISIPTVLVSKYRSDRVTIQERDKMTLDEEKEEEKKNKLMEDRRRTSRKVELICLDNFDSL